MKTVFFKGKSYEVPDHAKYIAQDSDGEICWFSDEPVLHKGVGCEFYASTHAEGTSYGVLSVGLIEPECREIP